MAILHDDFGVSWALAKQVYVIAGVGRQLTDFLGK